MVIAIDAPTATTTVVTSRNRAAGHPRRAHRDRDDPGDEPEARREGPDRMQRVLGAIERSIQDPRASRERGDGNHRHPEAAVKPGPDRTPASCRHRREPQHGQPQEHEPEPRNPGAVDSLRDRLTRRVLDPRVRARHHRGCDDQRACRREQHQEHSPAGTPTANAPMNSPLVDCPPGSRLRTSDHGPFHRVSSRDGCPPELVSPAATGGRRSTRRARGQGHPRRGRIGIPARCNSRRTVAASRSNVRATSARESPPR